MAYNGPLPQVVNAGGTGAASYTPYSVITAGTTSTAAMGNVTGVGTSGQVLTSNGAAALPTWQAAGGSSPWVLIQSQSASSSSSITFTSGITSTYNTYIMVATDVIMSTTADILVRLSSNGGSSYLNSGYLSGANSFNYNSTTITNTNITSGLILGVAVDSSHVVSSVTYLYNLTSGSNFPAISGDGISCDASASVRYITVGVYDANLTVNAFQVIGSSGTITSGTFTLYALLE